MNLADLPEHVQRNKTTWEEDARNYVAPGERSWADNEPRWGIWQVPESDIGMFPEDVAGKDAIELGCGTAYVSSWLARRGARVVGIDITEAQLATARRLQQENGIEFPLIHGNAETVPLPDESFDFAISEYGASLWADPYRWIPEAARLLRSGGRLSFLTNGFLLILCAQDDEDVPASESLLRPARGMCRVEWPDTTGVEFHLPHGEMIRLLRLSGFEIEDLIEIYPPVGAATHDKFVSPEWAQKWPSEEVWKVRKA